MTQEPDRTIDGADEVEEDPDIDGEESFPASDPPSHWQGEDEGD